MTPLTAQQQAQFLRDRALLSDRDIARAVGVGHNAAATWRRGEAQPSENRQETLEQLVDVVVEVCAASGAHEVLQWLTGPSVADEVPLEMLRAGRHVEVFAAARSWRQRRTGHACSPDRHDGRPGDPSE